MQDLRYPIGRYSPPSEIEAVQRAAWIDDISLLPSQLSSGLQGLNDYQLDTPYREGGWTVRQVVHHLADSHINSYVRFRLALTEDTPAIKAYDETLWAELADAKTLDVEPSLALLDGLHKRWTVLLKHMTEDDYNRGLRHPKLGEQSLGWMLGIYSWHGRHHVAHITGLKQRMGW